MNQVLFDIETVEKLIKNGEKLLLAGDEKVLEKLSPGSWIGGTIPYFMDNAGGIFSQEKIYVTKIPNYATKAVVKTYDSKNIHQIYKDAPKNGLSIIIIPAFSDIHASFALNSPTYEKFACSPLIGWISGISLDEKNKSTPKVFDGKNSGHDKKAVVFHVELPPQKVAEIQIINIFQQGDGDNIAFPENGFHAKEAYINGSKVNFSTYIKENNINIKLPLVADMYGAMINTSFKEVNLEKQQVDLYAPIFEGVNYKLAKPIEDYISNFNEMIPNDLDKAIFFSCNCILNYLYADLEGKSLKNITGPVTFGEIAYQLLNQTLAYVIIEDLPS